MFVYLACSCWERLSSQSKLTSALWHCTAQSPVKLDLMSEHKNGLEINSQSWIWRRSALPGSEKTLCKVKFRAKADNSGDKREEEAPIERTEGRRTKTPFCFEGTEGRKVTGLRKASWEWAEVKDRGECWGTGIKKSGPAFEELQLCSCSLCWPRTFSNFLKGEKSCGFDEVSKTECQVKPESKSCALSRAQER